MKILYVSTERGWHGGEEQLRLLVEGATAAGHACHIVARSGGKFATRMADAGHPVTPLPGSARGPRAVWRLRMALRNFAPRVVHTNDPHALSIARIASWRLTVPCRIASRRVLWPVKSTGKYTAWCDRVVCVSHAIAEVCRQSGIPAGLLRVVHSGIDPARAESGDRGRGRQSLQLPDEVPMALCVAQLANYKGIGYLIEAMPAVCEEFPTAVLALAGDGPLRDALEQQAQQLGVGDAVRFLGYRSDIPDLLHACDVFALVSPAEGLGTSVIDAMFAGRPVIGADAGGIPEMLTTADGRSPVGWLVPPRGSAAIAAAMVEAFQSPERRQELANSARERAANGFTYQHMVDGMLGVYREVLGD